MDVVRTLRSIVRADQKRKVELVRRSDGSFGFEEWEFFDNEGGSWGPTRIGAGSRCASIDEALREAKERVEWLAAELSAPVFYQLGWTTLPGLRGLSVSEFRAIPTANPDNLRGVAVAFKSEATREAFLQQMEADFAPRRFTNAADAFDTVRAYVREGVAKD